MADQDDLGAALTGLMTSMGAQGAPPVQPPQGLDFSKLMPQAQIANPYGGRPGINAQMDVPLAPGTDLTVGGGYARPYVDDRPEWSLKGGIRRRF
jgi:hypothetical protein